MLNMRIFECDAEASERIEEYCERLSYRINGLVDYNPKHKGEFKVVGRFNGVKFELTDKKTKEELLCYYNNFCEYYNNKINI